MILCYLRDLVPASFLRSAFLLSFTVLKNRPFILFGWVCDCVFSFFLSFLFFFLLHCGACGILVP